MAAPTDLRSSAQTFVALKYWASATRYEPNDAEKELLSKCEDRATSMWRVGLLGGAGGGFALSKLARVGGMQSAAVTTAFASVGSMIGQVKSNSPCLADLLELGAREESPLAQQARQIIADGGAATIERLQRRQRAAGPSSGRPSGDGAGGDGAGGDAGDGHGHGDADRRDYPAAPQLAQSHGGHHEPELGEREPLSAAGRYGGTPRYDHARPPPAWDSAPPARGGLDGGADEAPAAAPVVGDSWAAVRERYQARRNSGEPPPARGFEPASGARLDARLDRGADEAAQGSAPPRRVRRNQFGDEIVE